MDVYLGVPLGSPPQMAPPNLGSIAGHSLPFFTDFSDFLGRILQTFTSHIVD